MRPNKRRKTTKSTTESIKKKFVRTARGSIFVCIVVTKVERKVRHIVKRALHGAKQNTMTESFAACVPFAELIRRLRELLPVTFAQLNKEPCKHADEQGARKMFDRATYQAQYKKDRYARLKAAKICVECGRVPPVKNRVKCESCTAKIKAYDSPLFRRVYNERCRKLRIAAGLCVRCGKFAKLNRTRCAPCVEKERISRRLRKEKT